MRSWRIGLVTAIALVVAGRVEAAATKIVYWHGWTQQWEEMVNHVTREFEAGHPGIDVEPVVVAGNLIEKLVTAISAGVAPDVITVYGASNIPPLADKGLLVPLPPASQDEVENWVWRWKR
ncbi:MAG TPA: extracellular solute-binding protein [Limnochordia bacterium]